MYISFRSLEQFTHSKQDYSDRNNKLSLPLNISIFRTLIALYSYKRIMYKTLKDRTRKLEQLLVNLTMLVYK